MNSCSANSFVLLSTVQMSVKVTSFGFVLQNILIDPFMADHGFFLFRKSQADLLWTPVLTDQRLNLPPALKRNSRTGMVSIDLLGMITTFSPIRSQFAAYGGLVPSQDSTDFRRIMIGFPKSGYLVSFI